MNEPNSIGPAQRLIGALTLSRAQLASLLDVSTGTLYSWATGRRTPSRANAARLVDVARRQAELIAAYGAELARASSGARPRSRKRFP
ncbi:MAG TPA: helix-turn-helix transcriptional regulator [Longimicrobiales bacterium]